MANVRRILCVLGIVSACVACEADGTVREVDAGVSEGEAIAGGGLGGGALAGTLDVHIVNAQTGQAVPGASIAIAGRTLDADGAGHARFTELSQGATVDVTAAGYVPSRWVGVAAAELTVPLTPVDGGAAPVARARVRVTGLEGLPARETGERYQLRILPSLPLDLTGLDPARLTGVPPEGSTCLFAAGELDVCTLEVETHAGPQRLYGVVEVVNDAREVIAPAALFVSAELELASGLSDLPDALSLLGVNDLFRVALGRVLPPVDGAKVVGVPGMKLAGGVMVFPPGAEVLLPRAGGALGDGSYWYISDATYKDQDGDALRVRVAHRGVNADAELAPDPWPQVTARPVLEAGQLTFGPLLGSLRQVILRDANGTALLEAVMLGSAAQLALTDDLAAKLARVESVETFAPFDPMGFALPDVLAETLQRVERVSDFGAP